MTIPLESAGLLLEGGERDLLLSQQHLGEFSETSPTINPTDRSLQNDVVDGTSVTVPVGHVALSTEE